MWNVKILETSCKLANNFPRILFALLKLALFQAVVSWKSLGKVPLLFCSLLPLRAAHQCRRTPHASTWDAVRFWQSSVSIWQPGMTTCGSGRHKRCCLMAAPRWQRPIIRDETWITQRRHIVWDSPSPKARCVLHSLAHAKTVWQKRYKTRAERGR